MADEELKVKYALRYLYGKEERDEIARKDIRVTRTPVSTPGGRMKCGLKVLDGNGNVVSEIPPVPPCRQWIETKSDLEVLNGIDPGMTGDFLAYEKPAP